MCEFVDGQQTIIVGLLYHEYILNFVNIDKPDQNI